MNLSLRQARLKRMWTIKQAADCVGVGVATYGRWELGTQMPHLSSLALLCKAFDTTPEQLGFADLVTLITAA